MHEEVTTFGDFTGSGNDKWGQAVLALNDNIYAVPSQDGNYVLKIATATDTPTLIGAITSGYTSAALAENGNIYGWGTANSVMKIVPSIDSVTFLNDLGMYSGWGHGVLANDGNIYAPPMSNGYSALKINTSTDTASIMPGYYGLADGKWFTGILANNGMIYCPPGGYSYILKIDPSLNTTTLLSSHYALYSAMWVHGLLAPNGKIYCVPWNAEKVLVIDPSSDTSELIGETIVGSGKYGSAVLVGNIIYAAPLGIPKILKIDTITDTVSLIDSFYNQNCIVSIKGGNGIIYGIPETSCYVSRFDPIAGIPTIIGPYYGGTALWQNGVNVNSAKAIYGIPTLTNTILKIHWGVSDVLVNGISFEAPQESGVFTSNVVLEDAGSGVQVNGVAYE